MKFLCCLLVILCCTLSTQAADAGKRDTRHTRVVSLDKHKAHVAKHRHVSHEKKSKIKATASKAEKRRAQQRNRKIEKSKKYRSRGKATSSYERAQKKRHSYARAHGRTVRPIEVAEKPRTNWVEHAQAGQLAGKASWYGHDFHGGPTASGLRYDMYTFTAAHRTLPIGTVVKVTRLDSGKSVVVCVTDRGPYVDGRVIDLSYAAATQIDLGTQGIGDVNLEIVCDKNGKPLKKQQAFYVRYNTAVKGHEKAGPYKEFADACAMQEALSKAHPDAEVIVGSTR